MGIYKVPIGIKGPISKGSVGLLLGCSSLTSKGVHALMGIIDDDYEGEISIMIKRVSLSNNKRRSYSSIVIITLYHY